MLTTAAVKKAACPDAPRVRNVAISGLHLRDAVTATSATDRRHVLLVYGEGKLICWCGPYTAEERTAEATRWGAAGWRWNRSPPPAENLGTTLQLGGVTVTVG